MCPSVGFVHVTRFCYSHFLHLLSPIYQSATVCLSAALPLCKHTHTHFRHTWTNGHVRPKTPTKAKNRRRGNADATAGNGGRTGWACQEPHEVKRPSWWTRSRARQVNGGRARDAPAVPRFGGPRAKSGIPQPQQISSVRSQHALARRRATAITKQSRDSREGGRGAGSLPCLTCSELMKQEKLGNTSSINFHRHAHKHTITRASTDSGHIEHVF